MELNMAYSTGDLKARFGVSGTTIRNWATTYAAFLSPSANPTKGERRRYTAEDALVLATVSRESERRVPSEEIKRMLESGMVVKDLPEPIPSDLIAADTRALAVIDELRELLEDTTEKLEKAKMRITVYEAFEEEWRAKKLPCSNGLTGCW
jgi:DNA-binding transcriptional MerR regulator